MIYKAFPASPLRDVREQAEVCHAASGRTPNARLLFRLRRRQLVRARRLALDDNNLLDLIAIEVLKAPADPHNYIHPGD